MGKRKQKKSGDFLPFWPIPLPLHKMYWAQNPSWTLYWDQRDYTGWWFRIELREWNYYVCCSGYFFLISLTHLPNSIQKNKISGVQPCLVRWRTRIKRKKLHKSKEDLEKAKNEKKWNDDMNWDLRQMFPRQPREGASELTFGWGTGMKSQEHWSIIFKDFLFPCMWFRTFSSQFSSPCTVKTGLKMKEQGSRKYLNMILQRSRDVMSGGEVGKQAREDGKDGMEGWIWSHDVPRAIARGGVTA